jgi:aryl-alcohol dehydrogenase
MSPVPQHVRELTAAVVRDAAEGFRIERVHLGDLAPRDVLVEIAGTGMCHTDLAVSGPGGSPFHPAVFGHEGAGIVTAVGGAVTGVAVGDHVVLSYDSCGRCRRCRDGQAYFCESWQDLNTGPALGREHAPMADGEGKPLYATWFGQSSFATHAVATDASVVPVPGHLPLEILGPLGCGFLTGAGAVINALRVRPGDSIVIFGAGAVGMAAVMAAKICGAGLVVAVDPVRARLNVARDLGATHVFDSRSDDLAAKIARLTGGADYSFDTSGKAAVITTAVSVLRPGGTCGLVAIPDELRLDPQSVVFGRTVTGTFLGRSVPQVLIPQLIDWWQQGLFPFDTLIERFALNDINTAAQASTSGRVVKPVLIP